MIPPPGGGPLYADDFAGDVATLDGRGVPVADEPASWSVTPGTSWGINGSGEAVPTGGAASIAQFDTGISDSTVTATIAALLGTNSRRADLLFRYVDDSNWWRVSSRPTTSVYTWQLQKMTAGVVTSVGLAGPVATAGDVVEVIATGDSISWSVNGATVDSVTDSTHQVGTRVGLRGQFSIDPTSRWGSIEVT